MTSENKVSSLRDIYSEFSLSDFTREWHNKRTKLSRQFWSLILHTFYLPADKPIPPGNISNLYMNLFYRPLEIHSWIISHYDGVSTRRLKTELDFTTEKQHFVNKCSIAVDRLRAQLQSIKLHSQDTLYEINICEFDAHHPHLEQVSDCFIAAMNYGVFRLLESMVYTIPFELSPTICKQLDDVADALIESELFHVACEKIEHSLDYMTTYNQKETVDGPTQALRHALSVHSDLLKYPDQRIRYEISAKYTLTTGTFDHLQKAINRERKRIESKKTET